MTTGGWSGAGSDGSLDTKQECCLLYDTRKRRKKKKKKKKVVKAPKWQLVTES